MGRKKTLLFAGEDLKDLRLLTDILCPEKYNVKWIRTGKKLFQKVMSELPDLILVQSKFSDIECIEVCEKIHKEEKLQFIPLIIIGDTTQPFSKIEALRSGVIDCIDRPIEPEEFISKVERYLELSGSYKSVIRANDELREQFQNTFEHAAAGITHADVDSGCFLKVNNTMCKYLGYTEEELLQKSFHDVTHPNFRESDKNDLVGLKEGKISSYSKDKQYVRKDGSLVWGRVTVSLARYNNESIENHIVAVVVDISERKEVEDVNYKLHGVIERSPNIIMITNPFGEIEYVNPAFEKVTNYSESDVLGKLPRILQARFHDANLQDHIWETIKSGNSWKGEFKNHKKNGEEFWQHITIDPMFSNANIISNYIVIAEDITDGVEMFYELKLAKQKAEESDRLKSAFLASISHEIRTPLNAIIGFSELIAQSVHDEALREYSEIIRTQNGLLLQLINDLLDFSSIEAGAIEIRKDEFELNELMREVFILFSEKCNEAVELRMNTPAVGENLILSDRNRIEQILFNLLSNALKFTSKGVVEFGYTFCNENELLLFVRDTGIGISKKRQKEIFNSFTKLDSFSQGTGLGLSIVKNLVEMLHGTISVESDLGMGCEFAIKIPLKIGEVGSFRMENVECDSDLNYSSFTQKNQAC